MFGYGMVFVCLLLDHVAFLIKFYNVVYRIRVEKEEKEKEKLKKNLKPVSEKFVSSNKILGIFLYSKLLLPSLFLSSLCIFFILSFPKSCRLIWY